MTTKHRELFATLAEPFEKTEVKQRRQANVTLNYITARTAMNRLDDVLGPENWWDEYDAHENSVLCRLSIRLPDGSVVTKADAGGYAGMADSGDDDKSGYSDAFKRACVKFGVGRYLYRDGVPDFAAAELPPDAGGGGHRAAAPASQAVPDRTQNGEPPPNGHRDHGHGHGSGHGNPPRSGRALFAWTKEQEQRHEVGLLKYLNSFMKLQDFPARMVDLNEDQVRTCYEEAVRKLTIVNGTHGEPGSDG